MTILDNIVEHKRYEVNIFRKKSDVSAMMKEVELLPPARSLAASLSKPGRVSLLAEIKGASPSRGIIRSGFNPADIAAVYTENGADAISVLTDEKFFAGRGEYISSIRQITELSILRKDFIIDQVQILQARLLGADAVLLICSVLQQDELISLMRVARDAGMEALVEVHGEGELDRAQDAGARIIGINNRDLKTFNTDLETTFHLRRLIKNQSVLVVSESGISTAADMKALQSAGVHAALVGEALMSAEDMALKVRELAGATAP